MTFKKAIEAVKENLVGTLLVIGMGYWAMTSIIGDVEETRTPAPRVAAPPLSSRADLALSSKNQTFAAEILAGLRIVQAQEPLCSNLNPAHAKVSGSRETKSGYAFYIECTGDNQTRTIWFNSQKIIARSVIK